MINNKIATPRLLCIVDGCDDHRHRAGYCVAHWTDKQGGCNLSLKEDAKHELVMNELKLINTNLKKLIDLQELSHI